jgi:hypothetical protein
VQAHFPESTRREITEMVGHIKGEFEQRAYALACRQGLSCQHHLAQFCAFVWKMSFFA